VLGALYWTVAAGHWEALGQNPNHLAAYGAGLERALEPTAVLDLGTGAGGSAAFAATTYPRARVVGVDKSRMMLARARRSHQQPNLEFRRASLWRLPFEDASFELVTMLNCFPELGELHRILGPGGQALMATSYGCVEDRTRIYHDRWRDGGFELLDRGNVGHGTFELYARVNLAVPRD